MKNRIYLLYLLFFSLSGSDRTAIADKIPSNFDLSVDICSSMMLNQNKMKCEDILRVNPIQKNMAEFCQDLISDQRKIGCIRSAAGKVFSTNEMNECKKTVSSESKIRCVNEHGTPTPRASLKTEKKEVWFEKFLDALIG